MHKQTSIEYEVQGFSPGYQVHQDEESMCISAISDSVVSAAPSALRRGKYSYSYYDTDNDNGNSSVESSNIYSRNHRERKSTAKRRSSDIPPFHSRKGNGAKVSPRPGPTLPSHTTLPNGVSIGESGHILARYSRLSLLFKRKWKEIVWVHCKPCTLIFFGSLNDMQKWMNSEYLLTDEKKKIIKFAINFDTMGTHSANKSQLQSSSQAAVYKMSEVRSKRNSIDGSFTHRFQLERWTNTGNSTEASFCSTDVAEVKFMRKAVRKCLKKAKTPNSSKQRSHSIKIDLGGEFVERDSSKRGKSSISVVSYDSHDRNANTSSHARGSARKTKTSRTRN